jgi:hypothetical protein
MTERARCASCNSRAKEFCPDGYCRSCHKSLSFEDCCDGTYNAKNLLELGHSRKEIKELYPDARI